ncbi:uncharacterized protein LOC131944738 isoform X2 [Physella acuta]|uniref:uncharacterized protein LOC131944738 isoform X2 n=1 Tax=Physella acuta TaxID=109671 RepID=UPI0027DB374D|nr:uncharacterized protein LOC131944738 isoform X2 [Physella acuta]
MRSRHSSRSMRSPEKLDTKVSSHSIAASHRGKLTLGNGGCGDVKNKSPQTNCPELSPKFRIITPVCDKFNTKDDCICQNSKSTFAMRCGKEKPPDELMLIKEEDCANYCDSNPFISSIIVAKGILFVLVFAGLVYIFYKVTLMYNKSHEILSVLFLLLITLLVFEPRYFFPSMVMNSVASDPDSSEVGSSKPQFCYTSAELPTPMS